MRVGSQQAKGSGFESHSWWSLEWHWSFMKGKRVLESIGPNGSKSFKSPARLLSSGPGPFHEYLATNLLRIERIKSPCTPASISDPYTWCSPMDISLISSESLCLGVLYFISQKVACSILFYFEHTWIQSKDCARLSSVVFDWTFVRFCSIRYLAYFGRFHLETPHFQSK